MTDKTVSYPITGMTCAACSSRLQKVLEKKDIEAVVNFATETLTVSESVAFDTLKAVVTKAGFGIEAHHRKVGVVSSDELDDDKDASFFARFWRKYWLLMLLSIPFFINMLAMVFGHHLLPVWLQFVLASVVQFWVAKDFYKKAWSSLSARYANMDVLVVIGTLSIYFYSTFLAWQALMTGADAHHLVYFEASVMVIFFVSLGKFIEHSVKKDSLDSVGLLLKLLPSYVKVKTEDGFFSMPILEVAVGQIVQVRTHQSIALDGVVVSGEGLCDESHLTGESHPVKKCVGDSVTSGAMVLSGSFEYQVTKDSKNSYLTVMIDKLSKAQGTKAKIARIGDKVAAVFVPTVVVIALATLLVNYWLFGQFELALLRAVAVLVIACPCALGLATPLAIMAGMGAGARHGVWFKDAPSLEQSGRIDVMVFDKTGTLTQGAPTLVGKILVDGKKDAATLLAMAASVETFATHPLAYAVVKAAKTAGLPLYQVEAVKIHPQGVSATLVFTTSNSSGALSDADNADNIEDKKVIKVGKPSWVGFDTTLIAQDALWQPTSIVAMSIDGEAVMAMGFADDIKEDACAVLDKLNEDTRLVMMSGDRHSVVRTVAETLKIQDYHGDMSAEDKAAQIKALQDKGYKVCMIGDGVNDSLAMAAADTSFAVGGAGDVAKHTASARLIGHSLTKAWYAKSIAKKTLDIIHQNLFFAFFYNCIGIVLAMCGLLTPILAAAAMSISSLCVVANSYRLKHLKLNIYDK